MLNGVIGVDETSDSFAKPLISSASGSIDDDGWVALNGFRRRFFKMYRATKKTTMPSSTHPAEAIPMIALNESPDLVDGPGVKFELHTHDFVLIMPTCGSENCLGPVSAPLNPMQ